MNFRPTEKRYMFGPYNLNLVKISNVEVTKVEILQQQSNRKVLKTFYSEKVKHKFSFLLNLIKTRPLICNSKYKYKHKSENEY